MYEENLYRRRRMNTSENERAFESLDEQLAFVVGNRGKSISYSKKAKEWLCQPGNISELIFVQKQPGIETCIDKYPTLKSFIKIAKDMANEKSS